jgi:hypothetical protein
MKSKDRIILRRLRKNTFEKILFFLPFSLLAITLNLSFNFSNNLHSAMIHYLNPFYFLETVEEDFDLHLLNGFLYEGELIAIYMLNKDFNLSQLDYGFTKYNFFCSFYGNSRLKSSDLYNLDGSIQRLEVLNECNKFDHYFSSSNNYNNFFLIRHSENLLKYEISNFNIKSGFNDTVNIRLKENLMNSVLNVLVLFLIFYSFIFFSRKRDSIFLKSFFSKELNFGNNIIKQVLIIFGLFNLLITTILVLIFSYFELLFFNNIFSIVLLLSYFLSELFIFLKEVNRYGLFRN